MLICKRQIDAVSLFLQMVLLHERMEEKMKQFVITEKEPCIFHNKTFSCIGTGRMDLALHKEYADQLRLVQKKIGFDYIRGHGLFCRDMAVYQELKMSDGTIKEEYNFTYLDQVMDLYQDLSIRPFLELGFMPEKMASGEETVFYWKGNITPPADYGKWERLVQATLRHLIDRYGEKEVLTWPIEVWNEPNLESFWKDADMQEYFHLYEVTVNAVKEVNSALQVGGPAICGVDDVRWLREFLDFVKAGRLPLDFVTRHHYTSYVPDRCGHYGYIELHDPEDAFGVLEKSREIVDGYEEYAGMDIHITEYNTSYIPNAPIHDTCYNAAYVAHMLSRLGDCHASYSYWTFGDVFEEFGVPFTPFHGGFGLVANGCIPKPTFWTFVFYKKLDGLCIHRSEEGLFVKRDDGSYYGVVWNPDHDLQGTSLEVDYAIQLPADCKDTEFCLIRQIVDEEHGNPLKTWHELGEPANPTREEVELLREMARPELVSEQIFVEDGCAKLHVCVKANGVQALELRPVKRQQDTGYDYERTVTQRVAANREKEL